MASASSTPIAIGFVGIGAMGFSMATHLLTLGHSVTGFDAYPPSLDKFRAAGGMVAPSPRAAATGCTVYICMVASSDQVETVLFGEDNGAVQALPPHAVLIICSTVPATFLRQVQDTLSTLGRSDILLVDAPVSGGTVKAAEGNLTILSAGSDAALDRADAILRDMSANLYRIPGEIGAASNVKIINQLLAGVHIAAASEAMGLAAKAGLNTKAVYDIITNAAGNSWMFENRVLHMLDDDWDPKSALDIFVKDMGIVTSTARSLSFPVPLSSAAEQLYLSGSAQGYGREDDAGLVRLYLPQNPTAVHDQAKLAAPTDTATISPATTPMDLEKIAMIGLGSMGVHMACSLARAGFAVDGYDVYPPSVEKFMAAQAGKTRAASSPAEAAADSDILVLMVQNYHQAEDVLFGSGKAAEALPQRAIVLLMSTVPPSAVRSIGQKLSALGKGLELIDAPVSGGVVRAAKGDLTIISSGTDSTLSKARPVLDAMSGQPKNLYTVPGGIGSASAVKMINQLLAGVHIAAAAEAMAFAARLGLDTRALFDIIRTAAGSSWMFENRVPAMLDGDFTPHSALAIFVKDLGIVLDEAKRLGFSAPMSAAAHQLYLFGASNGWEKEADSGVVRVWESLTGVSVAKNAGPLPSTEFVPQKYPRIAAADVLDKLPPVYANDVLTSIETRVQRSDIPTLVVLDDDPTGTQTCHDIAVLTCWDQPTLLSEFKTAKPGFFILTNSRALSPVDAKELISTICREVDAAAKASGKSYQIVLRGDSTLRGHIPTEPEAVEAQLGQSDAWVLAPFFYQGGRYTIEDVHYVREGDTLVPAAETPFAQDATFGYRSSNLRDYILEKAGSRFTADSFVSITLDDLRVGGPSQVTQKLLSAPKGCVVIVNAAAEQDMSVFAAGALDAEAQGKSYLYRTGAAFVSARLGIRPIEPLSLQDMGYVPATTRPGGLIVAGSYVPKTTAQLACLREKRGTKLDVIELDVEQLITGTTGNKNSTADSVIAAAAAEVNERIAQGRDVLVMTSRKLITGDDGLSSLNIGGVVASALVAVVRTVTVRPRYLIAKGGITSSDAATKGLNIRRAMIVGQAAPGVPLWRCTDESSRHPGVPFVVFPGNVGSESTLAELVERWDV